MADFNIPDIVLIDRLNKRALVIDTAVRLTRNNLPKTEAEEIKEYENFALEI